MASPNIPALRHLSKRWEYADPAERANLQMYFVELCDALGAPRPLPAGMSVDGPAYRFEQPVTQVDRIGAEKTLFIDCFKEGHYILEGKDISVGTAWETPLKKAYGQAMSYVGARDLPGGRPPYVMVMDVGQRLLVWEGWTGAYQGYHAKREINLTTLHENEVDRNFLHAILTDTRVLDARGRAQQVTRELGSRLADLAAHLEDQGHSKEAISRFFMAIVFTLFAEDIGLLVKDGPESKLFSDLVARALKNFSPASSTSAYFSAKSKDLWDAMARGGDFGNDQLRHFKGHIFESASVIPLDRKSLKLLDEACSKDWSAVEPSIFGTLLMRALDPAERSRLGAEYTPRNYVDRLLEPALMRHIKERWAQVEQEVDAMLEKASVKKVGRGSQALSLGEKKARAGAEKKIRGHLKWLRSLRILDPACGSGNFLYAAMLHMKKHEHEVVKSLELLTDTRELLLEEISPRQFYGIEINPWAAELASVTLWIGYHQFWKTHHGHMNPVEPVIEDTGTIITGDALLHTSGPPVHIPSKDRQDPEPRIIDPVTKNLVPDPTRKIPYLQLQDPKEQAWPPADFIIGNPPYLGGSKLRRGLGDGYVDALSEVYPDRSGEDLVAYWVAKAAKRVAEGRALSLGFITTNSIGDPLNRRVLESAFSDGARLVWGVKDHPWVDTGADAAVRVSMLVFEKAGSARAAQLGQIVDEKSERERLQLHTVAKIGSLLTEERGAESVVQKSLKSNTCIAFTGIVPGGTGFQLSRQQEAALLAIEPSAALYTRRLLGGIDLIKGVAGTSTIDISALSLEEAQKKCPHLLSHIRTHVKPERDANPNKSLKEGWWKLRRPSEEYRRAVKDLPRHIVRPRVAKHHLFRFVAQGELADSSCSSIASDDASVLGVLSSRVQQAWAKEVCGSLEGRLRFSGNAAIDPFPFPALTEAQKAHIATLAEQMEAERDRIAKAPSFKSFTAIYNLIAKVEAKEPLSPEEQGDYQKFGLGVLQHIHASINATVCEAYGFAPDATDQDIVVGLVKLHGERIEEEKHGLVRWLRPDWQKKQSAATTAASTEVKMLDDAPEPLAISAGTTDSARKKGKALEQESKAVENPPVPSKPSQVANVIAPKDGEGLDIACPDSISSSVSSFAVSSSAEKPGRKKGRPPKARGSEVTASSRVWPVDPIDQMHVVREAMVKGMTTVEELLSLYPSANSIALQHMLLLLGRASSR